MSNAVVESWNWSDLRRMCLKETGRVLGDPHQAEDAAQEALARAWRKRHTCRDAESRVAWIRQIARNEALRLRSRQGNQPQPAEIVELPERQAQADPAEEIVIRRLDISSALEELSLEDRLLLQLRYEKDMAQPHIAGLMGLPEGTIKVRLHRLRHRLKPRLTEVHG
jgi:RNA polymerase sigma-70 factor (ECF subfamily)